MNHNHAQKCGKRRQFRWNRSRREAAKLIGAGRLTLDEVAHWVGVCRRTLYNWRRNPAFAGRVRQIWQRSITRLHKQVDAERRHFFEQTYGPEYAPYFPENWRKTSSKNYELSVIQPRSTSKTAETPAISSVG